MNLRSLQQDTYQAFTPQQHPLPPDTYSQYACFGKTTNIFFVPGLIKSKVYFELNFTYKNCYTPDIPNNTVPHFKYLNFFESKCTLPYKHMALAHPHNGFLVA